MPVIVAFFIRQFIIIVVQLGIFTVADKYLVPLLNKAIGEIAVKFGATREEAENILANEILTTIESLGLTVAFSKVKLPLKIAEALKFSSKGFSKRSISTKVEQKIATTKLVEKGIVVTEQAVANEVAATIAKTRGFSLDTVSKLATTLVAVLGVPIGTGLLVINTIDFAAWPTSSYQDTFQRFFAWFGIKPDKDAANSKVLSEDQWKRVFAIYQTLGVIGIEDPYSGINKPFTRENLIALVDKIAAQQISERGKTTVGWIIGATQGLMVMKEPVTQAKINSAFLGGAVAPADARQAITSTQTTKVFTGVVSQGVVGAGLSFTPRPDDLIESIAELRAAATNNLAPYLASLPAKVVYEVKVVSSIVTKDGFKQTGTTQRIQTGTFTNGTPKYKTVTNKFATLVLYVLTDKGTRTKLNTIVLGPVDSARLTVAENDLRALETALPALVTTNKIEEVKNITAPIITQQTGPTVQNTDTTSIKAEYDRGAYDVVIRRLNEVESRASDAGQPFVNIVSPWGNSGIYGENSKEYLDQKNSVISDVKKLRSIGILLNFPNAAQRLNIPELTQTSIMKKEATTLQEWYSALGRSLPSVEARSKIYEQLGLGQASYYTGTTEQNTKLLNALKGGANASPLSTAEYKGYINNGALGVS